MSLAKCKRDMSTRPPSVVARSVIRNELIPVLEWFIAGKPHQDGPVMRYAAKVRDLLAKDRIASSALSGFLIGAVTAQECLDAAWALHEDLREAEQVWAAGGEEALARKREVGQRAASEGRLTRRNASRVRKEGPSRASETSGPACGTPGGTDASEGPRPAPGELFGWKRLSDGEIAQEILAPSREHLFEASGFGAVRVDEPLKGFIAVQVEFRGGQWVEAA